MACIAVFGSSCLGLDWKSDSGLGNSITEYMQGETIHHFANDLMFSPK